MKRVMGWVLALGLGCSVAAAQTTEAGITARLMGKPLYLKGMWAKDKLRFAADGTPQGSYGEVPWTEAGFDAKTITLKSGRLILEGARVGTTFNSDEPLSRMEIPRGSSSYEKVTIEIAGPADGDFKPALDAIFAEGVSGMAPAMPAIWKPYIAKLLGESKEVAEDDDAPSPTKALVPEKQTVRSLRIGGTVTPPRIVHQTNPKFTQTARAFKLSASVVVDLKVDENGLPTDIVLTRPAGLGLDEAAAAAVSQYRFAPATRNGRPVKVELKIDVHFEIF